MKDDIDARLRELRTAVETARSVPMSASVMFNRSEFEALLDGLEAAIDGTLAQATVVVGDRDAVVSAGMTEAEEIVRVAEQRSQDLVSDTDVFRLASLRAEEIVADARREAEELRIETDEYVESKLANFEHTLDRTIELVRKGRAQLSGGHVHGLGDDSDVGSMVLPDHLER